MNFAIDLTSWRLPPFTHYNAVLVNEKKIYILLAAVL